MSNILEVVKASRRCNKVKREITDNDKKIRDNKKRVELLENLQDYIKPEMTYNDIQNIINNMKFDYDNRIDDHIIKSAELSKERKALYKTIHDFAKSQTK